MTLLERIWGDIEGYRCVVSGKMKHTFFEHNQVHIPDGKDVWYAISIFDKPERKIPNVIATKAFWLDIDIKDTGDHYPDFVEAITAIRDFVDTLGLPEPAVVRSGNGVHIYWVLDRHTSPEKWHRIAGALREACVEQDIKADHGITIDIARILRVPGTSNYKDPKNPKPVELLTDIVECTYEELDEALGSYVFKAELKQNAKKSNSAFAVNLPTTPKSAERIAEHCNQLRDFRDSRGNIPEPTWYAGLGVLALCMDGDSAAQQWSAGHPTYSETATADKLERAFEFAPTTCAKFSEVNPAGCEGCPYAGKITSPIQLGETVTPIVLKEKDPPLSYNKDVEESAELVETEEDTDDDQITLPKGYTCGTEGVFLNIVTEDEVEHKPIFSQPVWVSRVMVGENPGESEIEISWITRQRKIKTATVKQGTVYNEPKFAEWLGSQNINGTLNLKAAVLYIKQCIVAVDNAQDTEAIVYNRFGLNDSGFLVGTDLISATGRSKAHVGGRIKRSRIEAMEPCGTLEAWANVTRLLDKPHFWMHRFAVLSGLSAPIFELVGNQGSILSLAGESSGGKTTAAHLGVSAYGHPESFESDPKSTLNAFYENWRQLNNLPFIVNEATSIKRELLSLIVYAAANGTAREANNQDGTIRDSGNWSTITIFTSNLHLNAMPDNVLGEAERRRVLELSFTHENKMDINTGKEIAETIRKNNGVAGRVLLDYLMKNQKEIKRRVDAKVVELQKDIDPAHRFSVWQIASNAVIGEIAVELGIVKFRVDDVIDNAIATLRNQVHSVSTPTGRVTDLISEWTRIYQAGIAMKEMSGTNAWHTQPIGEARGRWNVNKGEKIELCLPIKAFQNFALDNGVDVTAIKQWITEHGVTQRSVRLSEQSRVTKCYVIPQEDESDDETGTDDGSPSDNNAITDFDDLIAKAAIEKVKGILGDESSKPSGRE